MDAHYYRVLEWYRQNGDQTYRLDYQLNESSIVVDAGGYQGDFAADIFEKYGCNIYVFEPITDNCNFIKNRFAGNKNIHVLPYALGDQSRQIRLEVSGDATSSYKAGDNVATAEEVDTSKILNEIGIRDIDLFKLNVEGAEYAIIDNLIATGWIKHIRNLQIQFHNFVEDADRMMLRARQKLSLSHHQTYAFRYVWENWIKTDENSFRNSFVQIMPYLDEMGEKIALLEKEINDLKNSKSES